MSEVSQEDARHIAIQRDAISSVIVSGDGNKVVIYNYHLDRQVEIETKPSTPHLAANPYRGISVFQAEDAAVYFGREAQVDRLWNRLCELQEQATQNNPPVRLLPILGASGSGKSSLARAGLLPELARRPLPGYRQSRVVVMTPGSSPLQSLAVVLARIVTNDPCPVEKADEFERVLNKPNDQNQMDGLRRIAHALPNIAYSPLVIFIDQFEEAYSLCKDREIRNRFIDTLVDAVATPEARVSVVMTLRSDFLGEMQNHPKLDQIIGSDQSVVVTAMAAEELRRAIAEPAKQAGHPLDEGLVDRLIEQTEGREGALPLLQFALTRIWEGLEQGKSAAGTLKDIGGVGGALAGEAQRIYSSLKDKEKDDVARRVFIGLVELGEGTKDTRRRATVESLVSAQDNAILVREVIGRFAVPGARLLTLSSVEGKEVVEVTHEALLEHWQQIREWLNEQRNGIPKQRRINALAEEWEKQGKKRGYLLQGRQLDDARTFQEEHAETLPLTERAAEFVRESSRQRWLNRAAVASLLILPIATAGFYTLQTFQLEKQKQQATLDAWANAPSITPAKEIDTLEQAEKQADAYRKRGEIAQALAYYRKIRSTTIASVFKEVELKDFQRLINTPAEKLPQSLQERLNNNSFLKDSLSMSRNAENTISALIQEYKLESLKTALTEKKFGELKADARYSEREKGYTDGALRETYSVLLGDTGAGADLDKNGRINSQSEAAQMPCPLLIAIEKLWSKENCSWFEKDAKSSFAPGCRALDQKTLSYQLFPDPAYGPVVMERIEMCQTSTKQ